jgi:transglutaminase-like putative cysteine protease
MKSFKDKLTFVISYSAEFEIKKAQSPNSLYIWVPQPVKSASQRNIKLLSRSIEPLVENYRGTSLYQFVDIYPRTNESIVNFYAIDVYSIETNISNNNPVRLNIPSPIGTVSTQPSLLVPSGDPTIKAKAAEITGNERLPYPKAQRIYNWLISNLRFEANSVYGGALEALDEKRADSYRASLLFCALARASGIPAQPVAGVIVNRNKDTIKHYWAEFWLDGFGWIPLDPALGAGLQLKDFNLKSDHAGYYFGSLDNNRIAFSRGERFLSQMTPHGHTTPRSRDYSLQNLWEEAAGGLDSYSSDWSDVTITSMYIQ